MYYIYSLKKEDKVVYVGRTENVKRRVSQHKSTKEFDSYDILREVEDLEAAKYVEDNMIVLFNPIYNKSLNSCGAYIKLSEELKGRNFDTAKFINLINDYDVKPVFADNYYDMTIMVIAKECEIKED